MARTAKNKEYTVVCIEPVVSPEERARRDREITRVLTRVALESRKRQAEAKLKMELQKE